MVLKSAHTKLALALCALTIGSAWASDPDQDLQSFVSWLGQTRAQNNLVREVQASGISDAQAMADDVHRALITGSAQKVQQLVDGMCQPYSQVDFLDSSDPAFSKLAQSGDNKDFESGFVRIEAVGCLSNGTAQNALKTYFSPDFRKTAVSELTDSQISNGLLCEQTASVPMIAGATRSCLSLTQHDAGSIHAMWVSLDNNSDGYEPIYHREGMITAIDTPSGPRIHVLIYAREKQKLTSLVHKMASARLSKEQQNAFEELNRRLGQ